MKTLKGTLVWLLVLTQTLYAVPLWAVNSRQSTVASAAAEPAGRTAPSTSTQDSRPFKVNRTVPKVAPVPLLPVFSAIPTEGEISHARVFEEPLAAVGGPPTAQENLALARAIGLYVEAGDPENLSPFEALLEANGVPSWRASLLLNVGLVHIRTGRPTRALREFTEAWELSRNRKDAVAAAVADKTIGEKMRMLARFGEVAELQKALADVGDRRVGGTGGELLREARGAVQLMETQPNSTLRCGLIALDNVLRYGNDSYETDPRITGYQSTHWGTTLAELNDLASQLAPGYRMAKRVDLSSAVLLPAVVHWSRGHFAALVAEREGRYLLMDPAFGGELWMTRAAFDDEMSGYALVRTDSLPRGWREVPPEEAAQVWGRGTTSGPQPEYTKPCSQTSGGNACPCNCSSSGMATYSVHSMMVSLTVMDTPVGYRPPRGPNVDFTVRYIQRDAFQPQIFNYWNLGTRWTSDWLSYVTDNPANLTQQVTVYLRGGGQETYGGYNAGTSSYATHYESRAVVTRTSSSPIVYQRRLRDGSFEEYTEPDGASSFPRKVFLTRVVDAQGNALSMTYDSSMRLIAVTDALGQVTTLAYDLPADPLKLTSVTDPFGRSAQLEYDASGHLARVTDTIGMQSQFQYSATVADFLETLTTPYGTTTFATGESGVDRWIEITDPLGGKERIAYAGDTPGLPAEPVPQGGFSGSYLRYRNTFYWDKYACATGLSGDPKKARLLHWLHTPDGSLTDGTLESEKRPLENRVWYLYAGQSAPNLRGTDTRPIKVGRVLDDGTTQLSQYDFNARGKQTKVIDPLGRETVYINGTNNVPDSNPTAGEGLDLLQVKRKNGGSYDVLASYTYNDKHQPLTITDARGAVTSYTYSTAGQVLTVTTPPAQGHTEGATTTFTYDTNGYLQQVSGPVPGASTSFTYDDYGRKRTSTDPTALVLTYDYDALDRVTKVTYPDTTYEETVYNRLDPEKRRDRLGKWTQTFYDALRRPVATKDAAGGTTQYQYGSSGCSSCSGGGDKLTKLVDPNGNATSWEYDLQGRVAQETRADASSESYTYETTTSQLKQKTDRKGVSTSFEYFLDGKLKQKTYSDTTPAVSYTYDPVDGLMLTAANGTDTLTWTYDNLDRVATEASTKNASTVGYTYDDAGNRSALSLDGITHVTYGYDQQSRLTSITRGANVFGFAYDTASRRTSMTYPNGVVTSYGYDGESRLTSVGAALGSTPITSFAYTLDAAGNRTRKTTLDWTEDYGYDALYRLVSVDRSAGTPSRWRFAYDPAGNRTGDQTDDAAMGGTYNNLNQLLTRGAGGTLAFRGTTNEVANVMVSGRAAQTASDNSFRSQAQVEAGTTDVAVVATDPSGNSRTNTYRVSATGAGATYTYDPNGNLTQETEGTDTWGYEWNANSELTRVSKNSVEQARFAYDPLGRRIEKIADGVTSAFVFDRVNLLRETRGTTTLKYVNGPGSDAPLATESESTLSYFHADVLGSIVRMTDPAGAVTLTRQYDAWGNLEAGGNEPGHAFTGREWDPEIGLYYYRARYYDAHLAAFISEDSIDFRDGKTRYGYVLGNPVYYTDPSGHAAKKVCKPCDEKQGQDYLSTACGMAKSGGVSVALVKKCLEKKCSALPRVVCVPQEKCKEAAREQQTRFVFGVTTPGSGAVGICDEATDSPCRLKVTVLHELMHDCGYNMADEDQIEAWSRKVWKCF